MHGVLGKGKDYTALKSTAVHVHQCHLIHVHVLRSTCMLSLSVGLVSRDGGVLVAASKE